MSEKTPLVFSNELRQNIITPEQLKEVKNPLLRNIMSNVLDGPGAGSEQEAAFGDGFHDGT